MLKIIKVLVMLCKWKLLRKESEEQSLEWTARSEPAKEIAKCIIEPRDNDATVVYVLSMLRKLVFKAAICCESVHYYFNGDSN